MGLFYRRSLCFFCFLFLLGSLVASYPTWGITGLLTVLLAVACAVLTVLAICGKHHRVRLWYLCLCAVFLFSGVCSFFLRVSLPQYKREQAYGSHIAEVRILEKTYSSAHSSEYRARLLSVDGEQAGEDIVAVFAYADAAEAGDRLAIRTELSALRQRDATAWQKATVREPSDAVLLAGGERTARIRLLTLRDRAGAYMKTVLGEESGALCEGVLLGNTEDMTARSVRDFRRSGISHLLSVSGLHMAVMMGAGELLLRRLRIKKGVRCGVLSVLCVAFLALTGFAMSACRSALMLLLVYFAYWLYAENDTLTSLFVSVSAVVLIMPRAINDIGLQLSFLATLGLVTVYPLLSARLGRWLQGRGLIARILLWLLRAVSLSVICSVFTLLPVWRYFGELSVMGIITNVLLSSLCSVFMILCLVALPVGALGAVGAPLVYAARYVAQAILYVSAEASSVQGAMLSLRHPLIDGTVAAVSVAMAILLGVRLRKKGFVLVPIGVAFVMFTACALWMRYLPMPTHTALAYGEGEEIMVCVEGAEAVLVDVSTGDADLAYRAASLAASRYATEIRSVVLTHYHASHSFALERTLRSRFVRTLYLPMPKTDTDRKEGRQLDELAERYGVEVIVYEYGEELSVLGHTAVRVYTDRGGRAFCAALMADGQVVTYVSADYGDTGCLSLLSASDAVIVGAHGVSDAPHAAVRQWKAGKVCAERLHVCRCEMAGIWRTCAAQETTVTAGRERAGYILLP